MRFMRIWPVVVPLLAACSGAPSQPVPVRGTPSDIAALVGEWDGSYESDDGMRRGSIDFHLRSERDTAYGDVVMVPQGWGRPLEARERHPGEIPTTGIPRPLVIRFVRVSGGEVSGELESHYDPYCGCLRTVVFRGRLKGDRLSGRYRSYREWGGPPDTGEWRVRRKKPKE